MKKSTNLFFVFLFYIVIVLAGCNGSESFENDSDVGDLDTDAQVSECGGFNDLQQELRIENAENGQCNDEILVWQYDQESLTLTLLNKDVWLNCCGERSITFSIDEETDTCIIDEIDEPGSDGGRCLCLCFIDFKVDLPNISFGTINLELYRHITDSGSRTIVWEGELDLGEGEGNELITENIDCD